MEAICDNQLEEWFELDVRHFLSLVTLTNSVHSLLMTAWTTRMQASL
jgi:hypothetical protein